MEHDATANFGDLATYRWWPGIRARTGDARLDDPRLDANVRNAVDHRLKQRGYEADLEGNPDFWISYHAMIRKEKMFSSVAVGDTYEPAWGRDYWSDKQVGDRGVYVRHFEEGSLILDILDADTSRLIWRCVAQAEMDPSMSQEARKARIQRAVRRMLARFPSR